MPTAERPAFEPRDDSQHPEWPRFQEWGRRHYGEAFDRLGGDIKVAMMQAQFDVWLHLSAQQSITLTTLEIADLAMLAGLECRPPNKEQREDEFTVATCPLGGVFDEDERCYWESRWIAFMDEYPEEGSINLGVAAKVQKGCAHA